MVSPLGLTRTAPPEGCRALRESVEANKTSIRWCPVVAVLVAVAVALLGAPFGVNQFLVAAAGAPNISASAAIVMDVSTGEVLYQVNSRQQRPMASTTKVMTAILVIENADLKAQVSIDWNAARTEGSSLYVKPGEVYSVRDLLYGLMLRSGNDTAVALAQHVAGSVSNFVGLMNRKAHQLGMKQTRFANPHGLPNTDHYSTAYDMALLTRYALHNPEFAQLVACKDTTIFRPSHGTWPIRNKNKLLWDYGGDGVKTGYTRAAGRCLIGSATRDGRQLVSVVLNAPSMWEDTKALLDYGFGRFKNVELLHKGQVVGEIAVVGGLQAQVTVLAADDLVLTVASNLPDEAEIKVDLPEQIEAPVQAMQPVGTLVVNYRNQKPLTVSLVAAETVDKKAWPSQLWKRE